MSFFVNNGVFHWCEIVSVVVECVWLVLPMILWNDLYPDVKHLQTSPTSPNPPTHPMIID